MWNLKYSTNEPIYKTKTNSDIKNRLVVSKGKGGEWDGWRVWGQQMQAITFRMDNHQVLLYTTGTISNLLGKKYDGRQFEKKKIYIYTHI